MHIDSGDNKPFILRGWGISKSIGSKVIVEDFCLDIAPGATIALVGRSGVGKSTMLHILGLVDNDFLGSLQFLGIELQELDEAQRTDLRAKHIGFAYQFHHLDIELNVLDNIKVAAVISGTDGAHERAESLLYDLGLDYLKHRFPSSLSGGQAQRIAILRAVCKSPKLFLGDEITGSLDEETGQDIMEFLFKLQDRSGMAVVLATHSRYVARMCDTIVTV